MLSSLTGILDSSPEMLALFVGFGLVVGLLFGFFGMGGSFLVTPALLMLGYPATVAVGSGMAFVFGTAVIATLKHHDLGQVDYKLGAIMIAGTTVGIEVGRASVFYLEELGLADGIISVVYVFLLGGIGLMITRESLASDGGGGIDHDAAAAEDLSEYEIPDIAKKIQQTVRIPPMVTLRGDIRVSVWVITAVAFSTGILSGFLGVGGGFIRMPAMIYAIGVPTPVAVGTDLFEIVFSGGDRELPVRAERRRGSRYRRPASVRERTRCPHRLGGDRRRRCRRHQGVFRRHAARRLRRGRHRRNRDVPRKRDLGDAGTRSRYRRCGRRGRGDRLHHASVAPGDS